MNLVKCTINSRHFKHKFHRLSMVELWNSRRSWFWAWVHQGADLPKYSWIQATTHDNLSSEYSWKTWWKFLFPPTFCNFGKEKIERTWCSNHKSNININKYYDKTTYLKFIFLSDSSALFGIPLINVNTCLMSQINTYLGFGGFLLNNPVIKLQTFGCLPTGWLSFCRGELIRLIYMY